MCVISWIKRLLFLFVFFFTVHLSASVQVSLEGDSYVIDNGIIAVRVPAVYNGSFIPTPILEIAYDGVWYGEGQWETDLILNDLTATPLSDGVKLRYNFKNNCKISAVPYLDVEVTLGPDASEVAIEEEYVMSEASSYSFHMSQGFSPEAIAVKNYAYWTDNPLRKPNPNSAGSLAIAPRARWSHTLTPNYLFYLVPRWSQGADAAYYSLAHNADYSVALGVAVCRAGTWKFPHNNYIWVRTNPEGGELFYDFPTQRGGRFYLILAGDFDIYENAHSVIDSYQGYSGNPKFYDNNYANPTGGPVRGTGGNLLSDLESGNTATCNPSSIFNWLHPDFWGYPHNLWSPINPNFYTDLVKIPALRACGCVGHEMYDSIRTVVLDLLTKHIEISWIVPGGAGECPGYNLYAYHELEEMAPYLKSYLNIDLEDIEAYRAASEFIEEVGRTPQGDTHPPDKWKGNLTETKEYPHFGVVFATEDEVLAWKAGPMRGHYHGDQLSFHWWDRAIDHQVSYNPRADQEHMHNRVAFSPAEWDYANMDGFERVIAYNTHTVADASIGQVQQSERLRKMPEYPPVEWQARYDEFALEEKLTYRRTMVMVKGSVDYFVIRDQHWGPELDATFCLHTKGTQVDWNGVDLVDFGNMALYVAKASSEMDYKRFDYDYPSDPSKGVMLTVSGSETEFITVMWPNGDIPSFSNVSGGVQVGSDVITFADPSGNESDPVVTVNGNVILQSSDVDLNRSQGYGYLDQGRDKWDASIYIPEVGYPMGPVPEWYLKQRVPGFNPEKEDYAFDVNARVTASSPGSNVAIDIQGGSDPYSYQWNTGATSASLSNVNNGVYTVTVYDADECYVIADVKVDSLLVSNPLLEDEKTLPLTLYPIPASDLLFYSGVDATRGDITVHTLSGESILKENGALSSYVSIAALSEGLYVIRIYADDGRIYTGQFVKE